MAVKCQHVHKNDSARYDRVWNEVLIYINKYLFIKLNYVFLSTENAKLLLSILNFFMGNSVDAFVNSVLS